MRFCINPITFGEVDFPAAVEAAAKGGFEALELWLPHVERFLGSGHSPAEARGVLAANGVRAVGACFVAGLIDSQREAKVRAFDAAQARFELCEALGATTIVCVGDGPQKPALDDYAHAAERLREVGDLAASFGLTVAVEFIAGFPFLGTLASAARVVQAAEHANIGILLDIYHFYTGRSKMADFARVGNGDIAFVHLNDARDLPREILTDADRVLPGEGCFPLRDILAAIRRTGYDGHYSLELFNRGLWEQDPAEVSERAFQTCARLEEAPLA